MAERIDWDAMLANVKIENEAAEETPTCEDCLYYVVCSYHITEETDFTVAECPYGFKNKADCEVNPQPARWIRARKGNGWEDWVDYTCPACKTEFDGRHITWDMNYCPSCGREMERKK
jgi:hypothetical protein